MICSLSVLFSLHSPCRTVSGLQDLRMEVAGTIPTLAIFRPRIDNSHWDRILTSLTTDHCLDDGYVGKQPVAWKEYCEY